MVTATKRLMVTPVSDGVWSVHDTHQRPVEGVAVWSYFEGIYECERCGRGYCGHVRMVEANRE